jgi:hypothetical protein
MTPPSGRLALRSRFASVGRLSMLTYAPFVTNETVLVHKCYQGRECENNERSRMAPSYQCQLDESYNKQRQMYHLMYQLSWRENGAAPYSDTYEYDCQARENVLNREHPDNSRVQVQPEGRNDV